MPVLQIDQPVPHSSDTDPNASSYGRFQPQERPTNRAWSSAALARTSLALGAQRSWYVRPGETGSPHTGQGFNSRSGLRITRVDQLATGTPRLVGDRALRPHAARRSTS